MCIQISEKHEEDWPLLCVFGFGFLGCLFLFLFFFFPKPLIRLVKS